MQITRAGEYAILGVSYLAMKASGDPVMVEEICRHADVPKSFLAKIFQALTHAGIVVSQRGMGGGFKLARSPEKITVLEIIEAAEGQIVFNRCLETPSACPKTNACIFSGVLARAQNKVKEVFRTTTLADLLPSKTVGALPILDAEKSEAGAPASLSVENPFSITLHD